MCETITFHSIYPVLTQYLSAISDNYCSFLQAHTLPPYLNRHTGADVETSEFWVNILVFKENGTNYNLSLSLSASKIITIEKIKVIHMIVIIKYLYHNLFFFNCYIIQNKWLGLIFILIGYFWLVLCSPSLLCWSEPAYADIFSLGMCSMCRTDKQ